MTAHRPGPRLAVVAQLLGVLALLVATSTGALTAQAGVQALEDAAERYRGIRSMCADFDQVLEVRLLGRTVESRGRLCQQRPNLFSMRFTEPDGDMVISDGSHFWVYYPSIHDDQVMRYDVAQTPGRYDFFREFLEDPGTKYVAVEGGSDRVTGKECLVIDLTPLREATYRKARLWLDPDTDLICRVEVHQENGSVRTVTLGNVRLNPELGAEAFSFEVPAGARVVRPGAS